MTETTNTMGSTTVAPVAQAATTPAPAAPKRSKKQLAAIVVCAILALAGIAAWIFQVSGNFMLTNMRNLDSWGLYIQTFMLMVGLSAGGLIISSVPNVFNMKNTFGGISKVAIWGSICCTVLAMGFVIVDLGGPERILNLLIYANLTSPLIWDVCVLTLYLVISIVYLYVTIAAERGKRSHKTLRAWSAIALICAISVHTVTAWIISLQQGREMWYTALMGPWFVASALLSGLGLVLVVVICLRKSGYLKLDKLYIDKMAKLLGVFAIVDLYFFFCDLLTATFQSGSSGELLPMLMYGPLAPFFWFEWISCIVVMLICFIPKLRSVPGVLVAAILSILAVMCKRIQLVVGGFQLPNLEFGQVFTNQTITNYAAANSAYNSIVYWPSTLEWAIFVGVWALGVFLLLLGLRYLPLKQTKESH
jgi:molybdopterin-containing oxidoreductase family membrane subunit